MELMIEDRKIYSIFRSRSLDWPAHIHEMAEIVSVHEGSADFYLNGEKYPLTRGDIAIVFPNQIHLYENSKDVRVTVFIIPIDKLISFGHIFNSKLPQVPVYRDDEGYILNLIDSFMDVYYREQRRLSNEISMGFIQTLTGILFYKAAFIPQQSSDRKTPVRLLNYVNEHYMEQITLEDVAAALNVSTSLVKHIFNRRLHTTFTQYIQKKRIDYACDVFKSGICNVTETAFISGFNCIRSFSRVFTKYAGVSPKQYIMSLNKNKAQE